ncbi:hypothetical protein LZ496_13185 [Sphingomonas sp. NSE70-1]|uniref:LTXXQ motif family protein n=1 Tax=Sphingomonas caseinilyticus TaxID=2908205 RepID=A0ABT0RXH2_9SPHN|nr:hypothetical protein [Sphingomonas caseinilyticus]MCL6699732.1 hypothetical protein [Sphingomonas caseinilyticus]
MAIGLPVPSCAGPPAVANGEATDDGVAAISLPEEQLRYMLGRTVMGTQSGPIAIFALGLDRGCDIFDEAADRAVARNLPKWRANLIRAYRQNVPAAELAEAVEKSPRAARDDLSPYLSAIGSEMKQASDPILMRATAEVLAEMAGEAGSVDRTSIDEAERRKDLQRMKAEGEVCGVGRKGGTA